ncbi:hypothetical protein N790_07120 [Arenimonas malthae CC-JY-1]|uniref:NADP-dependent oxidoreductase domain-containing protein n=1 Tax=Arenimonas malthae CC-JY-1 TaxID=1384054 RepID=A0A091B5K5_9GAMM|nr:aldo/keto reductase [Arenimonas malthae]KFN47913.1 hypothetical protein N790_07120 [Arenimonas malthae CC-JY-1]
MIQLGGQNCTPARIALGTAQFGLAYGVSNEAGQVADSRVDEILRLGERAGMGTLDTAIAYGSSEEVLGRHRVDGWRVVSKLPAHPEGCEDIGAWVDAQLRASLLRLRVDRLHALLLHRPQQLLLPGGASLFAALERARAHGLVTKIGISIYGPEELDALSGHFAFDIVQGPFNVVDRRLADSSWLARLQDKGCEFHARSAFMQGLLLMGADSRPAYFKRWTELWTAWEAWLAETGMTPLRACMAHVLAQPGIDQVVVGVTSPGQLDEILSAACEGPGAPPSLRSLDPDLVIPPRWRIS